MMHCWKDYREYAAEMFGWWSPEHCETFLEGGNGTCMLECGHEGEHEFVSDSEITIEFKPACVIAGKPAERGA